MHDFHFRIPRGLRRDGALVALSSMLCAAPIIVWEGRPFTLTVATTATMVGLAMYGRLAMGRWRAAAQVVLAGLALAASGEVPRMIVSVMVAGLLSSELVCRVAPRRVNFVKIGLFVGVVCAVVAAIGAAPPVFSREAWVGAGGVALGAVLGPGLMLGFAPVAEWAFGHVTPMTLTEWLSYDHPLLRDLALHAPGTFQHSVNVGLLADTAARAIGADPLLSRIGGLYHDVGKLSGPGYFVENQTEGNPHDAMDPLRSADIVKAHVSEGVALVCEHQMGRVVSDFVREHHGESLMRVFYQKAIDRDGAARESDFRYDGPPPRSRETAIVMIADQLEATARSVNPRDLSDCVRIADDTVARIVSSGELSRAPLTVKELETVRGALARAVFAMYHRRLTYPKTPAAGTTKPTLVPRFIRSQRGGA